MVSLTFDYKRTEHKQKCWICKKSLKKGCRRAKLDNDSSYQTFQFYVHLDCLKNKIVLFEDEIPINKDKICRI